MVVRPARGDDAAAMAQIMSAIAEEGLIATEPPVDVEARAERFRAEVGDGGTTAYWVLEDDEGSVLGLAGAHETAIAGVLALGMSIVREARGRGGGRMLLAAIVEHARARHAHKLELDVWPENARAIALYASAGFAVEGLRRSHYRRRDGSLRSALT